MPVGGGEGTDDANSIIILSISVAAVVPNMAMWVRADTLQLSDGDHVSLWGDLSGLGNSPAHVGRRQPPCPGRRQQVENPW